MATRGGYQREGERRGRKCGKEEIFFIRDLLTYTKRDGKTQMATERISADEIVNGREGF